MIIEKATPVPGTTNDCQFLETTLSTNTTSSYDEKIVESQYKGGVAQRAYANTNFRILNVALDFVPMTQNQKTALENFYLSVGLVHFFKWTSIDHTYPPSASLDPLDYQEVFRFKTPISFIWLSDKYTATAVVEQIPGGTAGIYKVDTTEYYYTADQLALDPVGGD